MSTWLVAFKQWPVFETERVGQLVSEIRGGVWQDWSRAIVRGMGRGVTIIRTKAYAKGQQTSGAKVAGALISTAVWGLALYSVVATMVVVGAAAVAWVMEKVMELFG